MVKIRYYNIWTDSRMKILTFNMFYSWFMRYFIYHVITFSLEKLGTHLSRNALLLAMSEILSSLLSIPMKLKMKRIPSFRIILGIISIGPLVLFFVSIPLDCFVSVGDVNY